MFSPKFFSPFFIKTNQSFFERLYSIVQILLQVALMYDYDVHLPTNRRDKER